MIKSPCCSFFLCMGEGITSNYCFLWVFIEIYYQYFRCNTSNESILIRQLIVCMMLIFMWMRDLLLHVNDPLKTLKILVFFPTNFTLSSALLLSLLLIASASLHSFFDTVLYDMGKVPLISLFAIDLVKSLVIFLDWTTLPYFYIFHTWMLDCDSHCCFGFICISWPL